MKRLSTFVAVAIAGICLTAQSATVVGQLGVLDDTANSGINPATGAAWQVGDTYHLAFVTSGTRDATSPDIADYHSFVTTQAASAGLGGVIWYNIGQSYNNPSRNTNAPPMTTTDGIFLVDGTKLADNGSDLADGPDVFFNLTEDGVTTFTGSIATGAGRTFGDPGETKIEDGNSGRTDGAWWRVYNGSMTSQWHFYAISEALTMQAVPEPSTAILAGLGLMGLISRRRK